MLITNQLRLVTVAVLLASSQSSLSFAAQCDFSITNEWNSGFTSSITISNDTGQRINGWTVELEYPDSSQISNVWNANKSGDNPYQLSNKNYNTSIDPGQSATFGFNSKKANSNQAAPVPVLSGVCTASNSPPEPPPEPPQTEDALCEFTVQNEWHSGYTGQIRITNDASVNIDGWQVVMTFPDNTTLSGSWNSQFSGNNPYTLSNANYNSDIQPGQSVQFGFNAQKAQPGTAASIPSLAGVCRSGVQPEPNQPPVAMATASVVTGVAPLTIDFSAQGSADPDGDVISYLWTFGDGSQSTDESPQFTFTEAGSFAVNLLVSDGELEAQAQTINVEVEEPIAGDPQSWQLDSDKSSLWFVSTKKLHILENHTFTNINGAITEDGDASLTLSLDSIESAIDIRNQRMREHLFETSVFPEAQVMLSVDVNELSEMTTAASVTSELTALLNLHGVSLPVETQVRITKLPGGALLVNNLQPIVVSATDFNLDTGIETLKQLAGLSSISYTVPVNFHLLFTPLAGSSISQQTEVDDMGAAK